MASLLMLSGRVIRQNKCFLTENPQFIALLRAVEIQSQTTAKVWSHFVRDNPTIPNAGPMKPKSKNDIKFLILSNTEYIK